MKNTRASMPPIGDYKSRLIWENACWEKILSNKDLLKIIITPSERHYLVMRATTLDRLQSGKSYRQIGQELWLSPQTISCIKKSIKESNYISYSERSKKERKPKSYSSTKKSRIPKPEGIPRPTKYGTLYLRRTKGVL